MYYYYYYYVPRGRDLQVLIKYASLLNVKYHRITTSADVSLVHSSSITTVGAVGRPVVNCVLKKNKI